MATGFTLVLTMALSFLAGCGREEASAPPQEAGAEQPLRIRIGADSYNFSFQFRVAQATGIFKKYGIEADISTYSFGIDTINAAILGETDSAQGMDYAVASRFSENNKLRIVAHIGGPQASGETLYTRLPGVNEVPALKGRVLGVKKGTVNEYIWGRTLANFGLDPKEVKLIYLGSTSELIAAYQAGEIDAFWGTPDVEHAVLAVPGSHAIGTLDLAQTVYRGYLLLDERFIRENHAGVVRLLRALDEATAFIAANPDETARIVYEDLRIPREAVRESLKSYFYDVRLSQADLDHLTAVANWSIDNDLIKNRYDIRQFVALDALREALPEKLTVQ